jgi:hypothetical protein
LQNNINKLFNALRKEDYAFSVKKKIYLDLKGLHKLPQKIVFIEKIS